MIPIVLATVLTSALFAAPAWAAQGQAPTPTTAARAAIDLNSATIGDLEGLPGIGRRTAERIIEHRQKNGAFKKIEELMNVQGIGEKSFLRLKPLITVVPPKSEKAGGSR